MKSFQPFKPHKGIKPTVRSIAALDDTKSSFSFERNEELTFKEDSAVAGDFLLLLIDALKQFRVHNGNSISVVGGTTIVRNNICSIINNYRNVVNAEMPLQLKLLLDNISSTFSSGDEVSQEQVDYLISSLSENSKRFSYTVSSSKNAQVTDINSLYHNSENTDISKAAAELKKNSELTETELFFPGFSFAESIKELRGSEYFSQQNHIHSSADNFTENNTAKVFGLSAEIDAPDAAADSFHLTEQLFRRDNSERNETSFLNGARLSAAFGNKTVLLRFGDTVIRSVSELSQKESFASLLEREFFRQRDNGFSASEPVKLSSEIGGSSADITADSRYVRISNTAEIKPQSETAAANSYRKQNAAQHVFSAENYPSFFGGNIGITRTLLSTNAMRLSFFKAVPLGGKGVFAPEKAAAFSALSLVNVLENRFLGEGVEVVHEGSSAFNPKNFFSADERKKEVFVKLASAESSAAHSALNGGALVFNTHISQSSEENIFPSVNAPRGAFPVVSVTLKNEINKLLKSCRIQRETGSAAADTVVSESARFADILRVIAAQKSAEIVPKKDREHFREKLFLAERIFLSESSRAGKSNTPVKLSALLSDSFHFRSKLFYSRGKSFYSRGKTNRLNSFIFGNNTLLFGGAESFSKESISAAKEKEVRLIRDSFFRNFAAEYHSEKGAENTAVYDRAFDFRKSTLLFGSATSVAKERLTAVAEKEIQRFRGIVPLIFARENYFGNNVDIPAADSQSFMRFVSETLLSRVSRFVKPSVKAARGAANSQAEEMPSREDKTREEYYSTLFSEKSRSETKGAIDTFETRTILPSAEQKFTSLTEWITRANSALTKQSLFANPVSLLKEYFAEKIVSKTFGGNPPRLIGTAPRNAEYSRTNAVRANSEELFFGETISEHSNYSVNSPAQEGKKTSGAIAFQKRGFSEYRLFSERTLKRNFGNSFLFRSIISALGYRENGGFSVNNLYHSKRYDRGLPFENTGDVSDYEYRVFRGFYSDSKSALFTPSENSAESVSLYSSYPQLILDVSSAESLLLSAQTREIVRGIFAEQTASSVISSAESSLREVLSRSLTNERIQRLSEELKQTVSGKLNRPERLAGGDAKILFGGKITAAHNSTFSALSPQLLLTAKAQDGAADALLPQSSAFLSAAYRSLYSDYADNFFTHYTTAESNTIQRRTYNAKTSYPDNRKSFLNSVHSGESIRVLLGNILSQSGNVFSEIYTLLHSFGYPDSEEIKSLTHSPVRLNGSSLVSLLAGLAGTDKVFRTSSARSLSSRIIRQFNTYGGRSVFGHKSLFGASNSLVLLSENSNLGNAAANRVLIGGGSDNAVFSAAAQGMKFARESEKYIIHSTEKTRGMEFLPAAQTVRTKETETRNSSSERYFREAETVLLQGSESTDTAETTREYGELVPAVRTLAQKGADRKEQYSDTSENMPQQPKETVSSEVTPAAARIIEGLPYEILRTEESLKSFVSAVVSDCMTDFGSNSYNNIDIICETVIDRLETRIKTESRLVGK